MQPVNAPNLNNSTKMFKKIVNLISPISFSSLLICRISFGISWSEFSHQTAPSESKSSTRRYPNCTKMFSTSLRYSLSSSPAGPYSQTETDRTEYQTAPRRPHKKPFPMVIWSICYRLRTT